MVGRWKSIDYALMARIMRAVNYTVHVSELHGIWGTKTLASEPGASLRASNFEYDGVAGGKMWTGDRKRDNGVPQEMKQRWVYKIMGGEKNE